MGRWKRKAEYYKKASASAAAAPSHSSAQRPNGKSFTAMELQRIKQYLMDYKAGCYRAFLRQKGSNDDDDDDDDDVHQQQAITVASADKTAPISLPLLNATTFGQPFLALPASLSAKQRQSIHVLCTELDVFHETVARGSSSSPSSSKHTRFVVLSIYANGFDCLSSGDVVAVASSDANIPFVLGRCCRPWFCQTDQARVKEETKMGRLRIQELVDQPSQCLREDMDTIHYVKMEHQDLSLISQPSARGNKDESNNEWLMVDSADTMKQCAEELMDAKPTELAFDLEFWNPSKYLQATCLLQLSSSAGKDYVIDPLAPGVWEHVSLLRPFFADSSIVKIGHCISGDIQSLHRDFGIIVLNAFDTYEAAKVANLNKCGLADVCKHYGLRNSEEYATLKELYQSTDWRRRPLTEPMIRYGRYDVHYLVKLRQLLMRDLTKDDLWSNASSAQETKRVAQALAATLKTIVAAEGDEEEYDDDDDDLPESNLSDDDNGYGDDGFYTPDGEESMQRKPEAAVKELRMQLDLMRVISLSQQRCLDLWTQHTETIAKNKEYATLMKRAQGGEIVWTSVHATLLENLIRWRIRIAAKEGCLPGMVCSLDLLVIVAIKCPTTIAALRRIQYSLPALLVEYSDELLSMVQESGVATTCDIPIYYFTFRGIRKPTGWAKWGTGASIMTAAVVIAAAVVTVTVRKKRR